MGETTAMINKDDLRPVSELLESIEESAHTALELSVLIKRAEVCLDAQRTKLLPAANLAFRQLTHQSPLEKRWIVLDGKGVVTKHTPNAEWKYPPNLVSMESDLRSLKKTAQEDKTATRLTPEINEAKNSLFAITVGK